MSLPRFDLSLPLPPAIERRPTSSLHHGISLPDDYGWLRAENWQEVLKKPKALPADIRTVLERENLFADGVLKPTLPL